MHALCRECPSIISTHSTADVIYTLGKVGAKILCSNPTPMQSLFTMGRPNRMKSAFSLDKVFGIHHKEKKLVLSWMMAMGHLEFEH
jgi:hypothetical protein